MVETTFDTVNRKLEQFLYVHDVFHSDIYKTEDGMTVWCYRDTPRLREVVAEYKEIVKQRKERGAA